MREALLRFNPFERLNIWPTNHQLFNTTVFMLLGKLVLGITITWVDIGVAMSVGVATDYFVSRLVGQPRPLKYCGSGIVTAFAICVLLRATNPLILPLAVFFGVAQKYFLKFDKKHFQNPSNIAVLLALLVAPTQTFLDFKAWGTKYIAISVVITCAVLLLTRVKLLRISFSIFALYFTYNAIFVSDNYLFILNKLTSTTFLLYTFFIINDPMAMPRTSKFRFIHIFNVVSITFFLEIFWGIKDVNIPLGLLLACMIVPILRRMEDSEKKYFNLGLGLSTTSSLVVFTILFNSNLNIKRNINIAFAQMGSESEVYKTAIVDSSEPVKKVGGKEFEKLFQVNQDLYSKSWSDSKIISKDYKVNLSNGVPFKEIGNSISAIERTFSLSHVGYDLLMYAPVASGDINQDGLLDVIVGIPYGRLDVLINVGNKQFVNVTGNLFDTIPVNAEQLAMVDFNNDGFLDLLVVEGNYLKETNSDIYLYNPRLRKFESQNLEIGKKRTSSGGVTVTDINNDGVLDFYISYGLDWYSEDPNFKNTSSSKDEFFVSGGGTWTDEIDNYFDDNLLADNYAGMTALFVDLDLDGKMEFLLGNDFYDPSFFMEWSGEKFVLKDKKNISQNVVNSMSYFPVDFNSDGISEIWENGISNKPPQMSHSTLLTSEKSKSISSNLYLDELRELVEQYIQQIYTCHEYKHELIKHICYNLLLESVSIERNDKSYCMKIPNLATRANCLRGFNFIQNAHGTSKRTRRFDIEKFPFQLDTNVILKKQRDGTYMNMIDGDSQFTGWSWAAYPFDINNDGLLDLYVTNGFLFDSHNTNKLLFNTSKFGRVSLENRGGELKLDFEDDSRGVIIADFDNDGDGDFLINNLNTSPKFLENSKGGDSIQIELRDKKNFYGLGGKIELKTEKYTQIRQIVNGGIWNSSQPFRQHFGIESGDKIEFLKVYWADGSVTKYNEMSKNKIYYIYQ